MPMIKIWSANGMPYSVPNSMLNDYLRRGFRTTPLAGAAKNSDIPTIDKVEPPPELPLPNTVDVLPVVAPTPPPIVNMNNATLKEISTLGVSTAIARKVVSERSYLTIEDLIAKVEGFDWVSVQDKITF